MKFNRKSRKALLSVVLGDGYLGKNGCGGIVHSIKQQDYLEWKIKFLRENGVRCSDISHFDNNNFPGVKIYINVTKWGKLLRKILYTPYGKDFYKRKILNKLDPIHLAIWYMDDGCLSQKKRAGVVVANELILNTYTTKEKNQIVIDYFKEIWGINFTQVKSKGHYRLRCGTKQARKFIDIIRDYVSQIPSMAHKLNVKPLGPIPKF